MLDDPGHRVGGEGGQLVLAGDPGDEARVELLVVGGAVDHAVEVGLDLEQFLEVGVLAVEQVVDEGLADEHDLGLEGDGLGVERGRHGEAHLLGDVLDADLAGLEGPLEAVPGVGLQQDLAGVEHEEAAVGLVQAPRP